MVAALLAILFILLDEPFTLSLNIFIRPFFLWLLFFCFPRELDEVLRLVDACLFQVCHASIHLHEGTPSEHGAERPASSAVAFNDGSNFPPLQCMEKCLAIEPYLAHDQ